MSFQFSSGQIHLALLRLNVIQGKKSSNPESCFQKITFSCSTSLFCLTSITKHHSSGQKLRKGFFEQDVSTLILLRKKFI